MGLAFGNYKWIVHLEKKLWGVGTIDTNKSTPIVYIKAIQEEGKAYFNFKKKNCCLPLPTVNINTPSRDNSLD